MLPYLILFCFCAITFTRECWFNISLWIIYPKSELKEYFRVVIRGRVLGNNYANIDLLYITWFKKAIINKQLENLVYYKGMHVINERYIKSNYFCNRRKVHKIQLCLSTNLMVTCISAWNDHWYKENEFYNLKVFSFIWITKWPLFIQCALCAMCL